MAETAACGCIPIAYDCRSQTEKPHWDEFCLWYRTKEDMRACLTQQPLEPPHGISRGRSSTDFAQRILTEVARYLSVEGR